MNNTIIHKELSDRIIGLALTVHYTLGPGLLESAYEEVMIWEPKRGHSDMHGCISVAGRMDAGMIFYKIL